MARQDFKKKDVIVQDLWGEEIVGIPRLRERYLEPPFTVFDSRRGEWIEKRRKLREFLLVESSTSDTGMGHKYEATDQSNRPKGIQGEEVEHTNSFKNAGRSKAMKVASEAVYDPYLLQVLWNLYFPEDEYPNGVRIIDTFTGSHISGCMAKKLGHKFTGIDVRPHIVDQNYATAKEIFGDDLSGIEWLKGDSNKVLDDLVFEEYDCFNSCPPYSDLVKYSKKNPIEGDISLLNYDDFLPVYASIIYKCCSLLKVGGYALIVVGEVRDKNTGELYNFVHDTVECFRAAGMLFYNSAILLNSLGTAALRAKGTFEDGKGKLVNTHQNILIFKKP